MPHISIFPTALGWFGFAGRDQTVSSLLIGHAAADEVRRALVRRFANRRDEGRASETDWFPKLRRRLEAYALGDVVDFSEFEVELPSRTAFHRRVLLAARTIPYGETLTYGQLAETVGSPRAARAVGQAMASNPVPIIVPCHRVVAAAGRLGGFSAPQGVDLKQRMLELESAAFAAAGPAAGFERPVDVRLSRAASGI